MRPRRMAAEISKRQGPRPAVPLASMRPRRMAAEIGVDAAEMPPELQLQ